MTEDSIAPVFVPLIARLFPGEFDLVQLARRIELRLGEYAPITVSQIQLYEGAERLASRTCEVIDGILGTLNFLRLPTPANAGVDARRYRKICLAR